jgi:hypothetical protein
VCVGGGANVKILRPNRQRPFGRGALRVPEEGGRKALGLTPGSAPVHERLKRSAHLFAGPRICHPEGAQPPPEESRHTGARVAAVGPRQFHSAPLRQRTFLLYLRHLCAVPPAPSSPMALSGSAQPLP